MTIPIDDFILAGFMIRLRRLVGAIILGGLMNNKLIGNEMSSTILERLKNLNVRCG